jgi:rubrerythrin
LEPKITPPFIREQSDIKDGAGRTFSVSRVWKGTAIDIQEDGHFPKGFLDFIVAALNEKYEREFGEKLRWEKDSGYHWCPKCRKIFNDERNPVFNYGRNGDEYCEYCPSCGQRLYPPEEENAE